jgi:hypothetical protein
MFQFLLRSLTYGMPFTILDLTSSWFTALRLKSSISWYITPCSQLKVDIYFGGTRRLHLQGRKWSWRCRGHFPTQRYIPEDKTLHNHRCENFKSYNIEFVSISLLFLAFCLLFVGRTIGLIVPRSLPAILHFKDISETEQSNFLNYRRYWEVT